MRRTAGFRFRRRKHKGDAQEAEPQWHAPARDTREGVSEGMPRFLERTAAPAPAPVQPVFQPTPKADDATAAPPPVMEETPAPVEVPVPAPEPVAAPEPEPEPEAEAAIAEPAPTPAIEPVEEEATGPYGGTVEPIVGEPLETFGCGDHASNDGMSYAVDAPGQTITAASPSRLRVNAQLAFYSSSGRQYDENLIAKADAVQSMLASASSTTQGGVTLKPTVFGSEFATYSVDYINWSSTTPGTVNVSARVFLDCKWDVQDRGRTNIPSASDAAVTKESWPKVVTSLTPNAKGNPPRADFWARDLTEKHEKFHATDDIGRATLYLPTGKAWLDTQTVSTPTGTSGKDAKVDGEVRALMSTLKGKVEADGWAYYGTGGEDRAYADGKSSYESRVTDVKARAVKEKW